MDTWILLRNSPPGEHGGRHLSILKSRGMAHSAERQSFELTDRGPIVRRAARRPAGRRRAGMKATEAAQARRSPRRTSGSCGSTSPARAPGRPRRCRTSKRICEEHLAGRYRIEVIDLLKQPQLARGDQIVAVPTLVRHLPPPMKKIIGDLSNEESVLVGLDLRPSRRRAGARP